MEDISLVYLLQLAWKRIWALILAGIVFAAAAFGYCRFLATPVYTATASILVTNGAIVSYTTETYEDGAVSGTDISASLSLANTVVDILKTSEIYDELSHNLKGDGYSRDELINMATIARRDTNTLFIDIKFKSTNGVEAENLANAFAEISCDYIMKFIPYAKAVVAANAVKYSKVSPRTMIITAACGLVGAVLAFLLVFLVDFLNQSIRGEDEFATKYDIPLIGSIPDFDNEGGTYYRGGRYYNKYYSKYNKYNKYYNNYNYSYKAGDSDAK